MQVVPLGGEFTLANPSLKQKLAPKVILALTESELTSSVARGENAGRKLAHSAVVRKLIKLGQVESRGVCAGTKFSARDRRRWCESPRVRVRHDRQRVPPVCGLPSLSPKCPRTPGTRLFTGECPEQSSAVGAS